MTEPEIDQLMQYLAQHPGLSDRLLAAFKLGDPAPHYASEDGTVLLGNKAIADTQRDEEDANGGLVAMAMRGYGYRNG